MTMPMPGITRNPKYHADDIVETYGNGGTVKILYETADANANHLNIVFPEGGGTDVPVIVLGDASIDNADLAWFDGVTEPTIAVVNDAKDAYATLDSGDDAVAGSKGLYFKAAADEDIELINLSVTGTPRIYWDESESAIRSTLGWDFDASVFIGDSANAASTLGLTVNQGAADDEIIALKSSDVAHAFTTGRTEADTFAYFKKSQGNGGGVTFAGITDGDATVANAIFLHGVSGIAADTTKTTAGRGIVETYSTLIDSGAEGAVGANGNLVAFQTVGACRFIFDVEGSAHADVEWVAFAEHDDLAVVNDVEQELLAFEDSAKTERRHLLEQIGIIGANSWHIENGRPKAMVNFTKLAMLHHGALMQIGERLTNQALEISELKQKLLAGG